MVLVEVEPWEMLHTVAAKKESEVAQEVDLLAHCNRKTKAVDYLKRSSLREVPKTGREEGRHKECYIAR